MIELDIVERLRGKVRVPVNDGAGLLDGKDFFERTFPTSKAAMEAADEIERLRKVIEVARYYYDHYCQDEAEEADLCINDEQHVAAQAFRDALRSCPSKDAP